MDEETDEWVRRRLGKVTASRVHDVVKVIKGGAWGAGRRKYLIELLGERFTGMRAPEGFKSEAVLWGRQTEPQAQAAYERRNGEKIDKVVFFDHPVIPMSGCSPDGLVGDHGMVQIKCPETHTHMGYLIDRAVPEPYLYQIHWELACTERRWSDFVSYDPRLPAKLAMLVIRVNRDPKIIAGLEKMAADFLREMEVITETLMGERHLESQSVGDDVYSGIVSALKGRKK